MKKDITVNISESIIHDMDKYRLMINDYSDEVKTRSEFVQTALVYYLGYLINLQKKMGEEEN